MVDSGTRASRKLKAAMPVAAAGPLAAVLTDEQARLREREALLVEQSRGNGAAGALQAQADLKSQLSVLERGIAAARHEAIRRSNM